MMAADEPVGTYTAGQLALVRRQMDFWITNSDDSGALADWSPVGVLTAPRGVREGPDTLPTVVAGWHELFEDLRIELQSLFASADGTWLGIEWTWIVKRRSDGAESATSDAIIVELSKGKIVGWREYFDTFGSVEFNDA